MLAERDPEYSSSIIALELEITNIWCSLSAAVFQVSYPVTTDYKTYVAKMLVTNLEHMLTRLVAY